MHLGPRLCTESRGEVSKARDRALGCLDRYEIWWAYQLRAAEKSDKFQADMNISIPSHSVVGFNHYTSMRFSPGG